MKVLIVGNGNLTGLRDLYMGLILYIKEDIKIDLFETNFEENIKYEDKYLNKVYKNRSLKCLYFLYKTRGIRRIFGKLFLKFKIYYDVKKVKDYYDIIHVIAWSDITNTIVKNKQIIGKKLIISVTGSDFYRKRDEYHDRIRKKLFKYIDAFTFVHKQGAFDFLEYYECKQPVYLNIFGKPILDSIERKKKNNYKENIKTRWSIPNDKIVVVIGTNGHILQRHIKIMNEILKLDQNILDHLYFIFPLTYRRSENHIHKLKKLVNDSKLSSIFLENFLSEDELADIRIISDVLIQLQPTDMFSGAMLEHLYTNGIVVTGSWLPYDILIENKAFYYTIDDFDEISNIINEIFENFISIKEKCKINKDIVYNLTSFEKCSYNWFKTYQQVLLKNKFNRVD